MLCCQFIFIFNNQDPHTGDPEKKKKNQCGDPGYGLSVGFQLWVPLAKAQSSAVAAR